MISRKSSVVLTSLLLLVVSVTGVSGPASATTPKCTITGTAKADVLVGTNAADVICGLAGNDRINGLSGNDTIYGGPGNDYLIGSDGNDYLDGGSGNDVIDGSNQDDELTGGAGNDQIFGGIGSDQLDGGSGSDSINGGEGSDKILGGAGNDKIDGGPGLDELKGDTGNDTLIGGDERDYISGGAGSDTIQGGLGDDSIDGGKARDWISSGGGSDRCSKDKADVHTDACDIDTAAPVLEPRAMYVPTFKAGDELSISWMLSDESGVSDSWATIGGAPGWITNWCEEFIQRAERISGDEFIGIYALKNCRIPENAVNGEYTLWVSSTDWLSNSAVQQAVLPFNVVGGSTDNKAPEVTKVEAVGSVSPGATIDVYATVKDETGIAGLYIWVAYYGQFWDGQQYAVALDEPVLVEGNNKSGVYKQRLRFRDNLPKGSYHFWYSAKDQLGNKEFATSELKLDYLVNELEN